jgi:phage-related protein
MTQKIGLEALLKTKQFIKGLGKYLDGLGKMDAETAATSKSVNKVSQVISKGMGIAAVAAAAAAAAIVAGLAAVGVAMAKLAIDAARLEGIGQAFTAMAGSAGLALDDLRTAARGTISDFELMTSANMALVGSGEELAAAFGENLPRLLEIAQASAKATGRDAGFLFESLVNGIKKTSPMLIDNTNLQLKLGEANQKLADELGIAVEQMSAEQKQLALLNATLEAGTPLVDQFGGGQLTAAEQMSRMRAQLKNITDTVGLAFLPALKTVVDSLANVAEAIARNIREGGILQDVLVTFGAWASIAADGFAELVRLGSAALSQFMGTMSDTLAGATESAFEWGIDIAVALADGLIKGASAALTFAMNFIGNLLTSWLAPGSPPRVAPELDKWGAAALTSWLEGMTQADFGILKGVQGSLQSILKGPDFQKVTAGLIESLGTGDMSGFFDQVAKAGGEFGDEIVELAQKEIALAKAIDTVAKAEADLAKAREDQVRATGKVAELTAEYNELLRDNADPKILQAQLDQINAAEEQAKAAAERENQAKKVLDSTEGEISVLEDQLSLQEQLVNQLLGLAGAEDAAAQAKTAAAGAGKGVAGIGEAIGAGLGGGVELGLPDIGQLLADKIAAAKQMILEKIAELIEPIRQKFETEWKPIFEGLAKKWAWFTGKIEEFWNEKVVPVATEIRTKFITALTDARDYIRNELMPKFRAWANYIVNFLRPRLVSIATKLTEEVIPALVNLWTEIKDNVIEYFTNLWEKVGEVGEKLSAFQTDILDKVTLGFNNLKTAIGKVITKVGSLITKIKELDISKLNPFLGQSPSPLEIGLRGISDAIDEINRKGFPSFSNQMTLLPASAGNTVNTNIHLGGQTIQSGMDVAMFKRLILSTVEEAVRNAT